MYLGHLTLVLVWFFRRDAVLRAALFRHAIIAAKLIYNRANFGSGMAINGFWVFFYCALRIISWYTSEIVFQCGKRSRNAAL